MSNINNPRDLYRALFIPFSDEVKREERMGGKGKITFVEWYHYIARAWIDFPKGFSTEVRQLYATGGINKNLDKDTGIPLDSYTDDRQLILIVRVTDNETGIYHEGTGSAPLSKPKKNFGGCNAEAEAQALKRAFAKFGLGLEMYMDEDDIEQTDPDAKKKTEPTPEQLRRIKQLIDLFESDDEAAQSFIKEERAAVRSVKDKKFRIELAIQTLIIMLEEREIEVPDPL